MSRAMERPFTNEAPRSPRTTCPSQSTYWTSSGRSSPSSARFRRTCSGVSPPASPSAASTTSPGARLIMKKTSDAEPRARNSARIRRWTTYARIAPERRLLVQPPLLGALAMPGEAGEVDVALHVRPGGVRLLAGHEEDHRHGLHQPLEDLGVQLLALLLAGAHPRLVQPGIHVAVAQLEILAPERLAVEEAPQEIRVGVRRDHRLDDE